MKKHHDDTRDSTEASRFAERDIIALGIAVAALILFVGTGGAVMPQILRSWLGVAEAPSMLLTNAVLLNIALLIFGWRRYKELNLEVIDRRRAEERARELAQTDPLTGCLNRRSGPDAIADICKTAAAEGRDIAVLMVDLDDFKQINDLNGHQMGDRVLTCVVKRIRSLLPADGVIARIGGDEFICALPFDPKAKESVDQFVEALITKVSRPIEHNRCCVEATVSVGIAALGSDALDCETKVEPTSYAGEGEEPRQGDPQSEALIHRADIAMYHAKKRGRNRFFWFEPQMEDELRVRNELETGIRRGITSGEFVPFYEQQVDLETGELLGFEMLARWQSPRFGLVSPEIFIPIAEEIDVISELSETLIRQALNDAKSWDPKLTLSVNVSPLQLRDPWFAQKLLRLLVESGFPAARLEVEITESCLHENIGAVHSIVTSLKNQGISLSLDDFGTGYSSLAQLRNLPFDRLKIDRSFVAELADEGHGSDLVAAIVSLGKGLNLPLTAEGVETDQVRKALQGMGGMKGQGYLYGKPEDAQATLIRLADLGLLASDRADLSDEAMLLSSDEASHQTDKIDLTNAGERKAG